MSVNVPLDVRRAFARLAFARDVYTGELLRQAMAREIAAGGMRGEIEGELARDALAAIGKRAKIAMLALVILCAAGDLLPRAARRASRPPSSCMRLARGSSRKIGEWEALA